jgi:hypothetical protein
MAKWNAKRWLVCGAILLTPALAAEPERKDVDQHLEWSRRTDRIPDPDVTGSLEQRIDVLVDVRRRRCLPARSLPDDTFAQAGKSELC